MRGNNFVIWWPPSWGNRKFENNRETSCKPNAVVPFYEAKNSFTITLIHFLLQQVSFQLKIFVKRLDKTVNVFHLRFCRLLKEPKPKDEFLGKTPYRGASSNWEHDGAPETAPVSIPEL